VGWKFLFLEESGRAAPASIPL